jgi:nucleoside phosphorylase
MPAAAGGNRDGPMTTPLQLVFAVPQEAAPLRRRGLPAGVAPALCGMGPANARRWITGVLAAGRPAAVLTGGFAGGLDPALRAGDVVFDAAELAALAGVLAGLGARPATFAARDRIAVTPADKAALRAATGADAVEMESAEIRRLCRAAGVPSATVRVVSDAADEALPLDFNRLVTPDWRLSPARLAAAVLARPWKIPALLRLGRTSAAAAGRLADVLAAALARRDRWLPR